MTREQEIEQRIAELEAEKSQIGLLINALDATFRPERDAEIIRECTQWLPEYQGMKDEEGE